jgi:hypothetical protein
VIEHRNFGVPFIHIFSVDIYFHANTIKLRQTLPQTQQE